MITLEHINKIRAVKVPEARNGNPRDTDHPLKYVKYVLSVWDETKSVKETMIITGVAKSTLRNFRVRRGDL